MHEMKDIQINNQEVLDALNEFKDLVYDRWKSGQLDKDLEIRCSEHERERWLDDGYMHRIIDRGEAHEGFPESMQCYHGLMPSNGERYNEDISKMIEYRDASLKLNSRLMTELSAKRNTLVTCYPPGGWISWHNNANAAGYNVIFSWSENGDGWFDYWDSEKKERVRVPDHAGWQCKMTYFGSYDEKENLCYHAASTDCLRISVAYVWGAHESMWEDIIEDIENPL